MGMYNEVFDICPECGQLSGYLQTRQIVLGFGRFNISDLADLKHRYDTGDLSARDIEALAAALEDEVFCCKEDYHTGERGTGCHHTWRPDPAKIAAIHMLPRVNSGDSEYSRA